MKCPGLFYLKYSDKGLNLLYKHSDFYSFALCEAYTPPDNVQRSPSMAENRPEPVCDCR